MSSLTIAVDVAKQVFELAVSPSPGRISERLWLSRSRFELFWSVRPPCRVVMEACATSHYWGRRLRSFGFEVILIPPHYVRAPTSENKISWTARRPLQAIVRESFSLPSTCACATRYVPSMTRP